MESISTSERLFYWERDSGSNRQVTLRSATDELGKLVFASCGSLAAGQTAVGEWTLKRDGFIHPRVTVRRTGSDVDVAVLSVFPTGGGTAVMTGAGEFELRISGWLQNRMGLWQRQLECLRFERKGNRAQVRVLVELDPEPLSVLLLLSWYTLVLADDDASAAAASMAAMTAVM